MSMSKLFAAAVFTALAPLTIVIAAQPPAGPKSIIDIVEQLEHQGYGPFLELSLDDGAWEVEVYRQDAPYELAVDAYSGEILSEHRDDAEPRPPRNAQPLSQILRGLEKAGYKKIDEVSFERRYWEIESFRADGKHEIHVDPKTGAIIHDRLDD